MKKIILLITVSFCCLQLSYSQPGKLDFTFGIDGVVRTNFDETRTAQFSAIQVLTKTDGTIYLIIKAAGRAGSDKNQTVITRLHANGTTDLSYGYNGYSQITPFEPASAVLQSDGKILVGGSTGKNNPSSDFALARFNPDGTLDHSFSGDGMVTTDFASNRDFINSVAIQSDGKIIAAGSVSTSNNNGFALARYNTDGTLDPTFSQDGKQITYFGFVSDGASSVAIQNDGKIVAVGNTAIKNSDFAIARYNTNGTLDASFSGDGKQTTDFKNGGDGALSVVLQSDGKIVAVGKTSKGDTADFALARYNTNGTLDASFSGDGKQTAGFKLGFNTANSVSIQNDGKIVVAGRDEYDFIAGNSGDPVLFTVFRYKIDGTPDPTFSNDGKLTTDFGLSYVFENPSSIAVQSNGKILVSGNAVDNGENSDFAVVRYNTNGIADNSFSEDGKLADHVKSGNTTYYSTAIQSDGKIVVAGGNAIARYNINGKLDISFSGDGKQNISFGNDFEAIQSVAIQSNGKIVVAGYTVDNTENPTLFALARFNTDGFPDNTFSGDGQVTTSFEFGGNALSVAIQSDGKIVAAGQTLSFGEDPDFVLARYNTDGTLDPTFSGDGKLTTDFARGDRANSVSIQSDGKIIAAGFSDHDNTTGFALARYNTDGSLDNTFSKDGKQITDFSFGSIAQSVAIQNDGKIVVAGNLFNTFEDQNYFALTRYNSDGSLDNTFSEDGKQSADFASDHNGGARSVAIQNDGKIVVAGSTIKGGSPHFTLVRYNTNGSLDQTFGEDGKQVTEASQENDIINDIAISGNKLYAAGTGSYIGKDGVVTRYLLGDNNQNEAPIVNLILPENNMVYSSPANIYMKATASDGDGSVTQVQFYSGTTLLHTEHVTPYGFSWNNVPVGEYTLTAKATDNSGNVTTSNSVKVSVINNKPPSVSITLPADKAIYGAPASVFIKVTAHDEDGSIKNVEFYNGSILLHTEYVAPYSFLWNDVPIGNYKLTAKATDNSGLTGTSAVIHISVVAPNSLMVSNESLINNSINQPLSLNLSPNPVHNILNISINGKLNKPTELYLLSASGVVVKNIHSITSNQLPLNVSSLGNGVYFIKIICGDKVMYKQFVKM